MGESPPGKISSGVGDSIKQKGFSHKVLMRSFFKNSLTFDAVCDKINNVAEIRRGIREQGEHSSAGQSTCLTSRGSQVRTLLLPPII